MFVLEGTEAQNRIIAATLARCDFPWDVLAVGLAAEGKTGIPVDWRDLSRYGAAPDAQGTSSLQATAAGGAVGHDDHHHDGAFDVLEYRSRVLGLAWYSGRVTIEATLEDDPDLAAEVFLSEAAHIIDFYAMTDEDRVAVWNAAHGEGDHLHPGTDIVDGVDLGHGHGWFDVGGYYSWVGEAWMGLFVRAFSDLPVTIDFDHLPTDEAAHTLRHHWLGDHEPPPDTEVDAVPPPPGPGGPDSGAGSGVFSTGRSRVAHDEHGGIPRERTWPSLAAAVEDGQRPCRVCKPAG